MIGNSRGDRVSCLLFAALTPSSRRWPASLADAGLAGQGSVGLPRGWGRFARTRSSPGVWMHETATTPSGTDTGPPAPAVRGVADDLAEVVAGFKVQFDAL